LRVMSCRNAGWQALKRARYGTAHSCFTRMARDDGATREEMIEGSIGMAIVHHLLGQQRSATELVQQAVELAGEADDPLWSQTVALLAADCSVRGEICCSGSLTDHAFWHSGRETGMTSAGAAPPPILPDWAKNDGAQISLIANHFNYLRYLYAVAQGESESVGPLSSIIAQRALWPGRSIPVQAKVDAVLAALSGGFAPAAERILETISKRDIDGVARRWNLDLLYARAKVAAHRGQMQSALQLYTTYSQEALLCLRLETLTLPAQASRTVAGAEVLDDIAARLPAKYRRAYRYMVEHISDYGLSTREVAAHIYVTERSLQMMFKHSLGISPGALIRQLRLQGIHDELQTDVHSAATVLDTAHRWGLNSRSTLVKSYRKQFDESPSETLNG